MDYFVNGWKPFAAACGIIYFLLRWHFTRMMKRVDGAVTKTELKHMLQEQNNAAALRQQMQQQMHDQNSERHQAAMQAMTDLKESTDEKFAVIFHKMDEKERNDMRLRHDLRESVDATGKQVAVLTALYNPRAAFKALTDQSDRDERGR